LAFGTVLAVLHIIAALHRRIVALCHPSNTHRCCRSYGTPCRTDIRSPRSAGPEAVRTGSFAATARSLGYTTSAVSQQIAILERTVGAQLFERSARRVWPTAIDERMALLSRDALAALSGLEREVRALSRGHAGTLRLASFATANVAIMPAALAAVAEQRPGAEVLLDEGDPDEGLAGVLYGDQDAAVVFAYDLCPQIWPRELCSDPTAVGGVGCRDGAGTPTRPEDSRSSGTDR
jgi:DNA-binding transcriptional LysR family regulator